MFSEKVTLQILISLIIWKKNKLNSNNLRKTLSKHTHGERGDLSASADSRCSESSYPEATRVICVSQNFKSPPPPWHTPSSCHEIWRMFLYFLTFFSILIIFLFRFPSETQTGMSFAFLSTVSQKALKICPFFVVLFLGQQCYIMNCVTLNHNSAKGCAKLVH